MKLTLEQLKGMSNGELYRHWVHGKFPFEMLRPCSDCLTMHANGCKIHPEIARSAAHLAKPFNSETFQFEPGDPAGAILRAHLEELYALRLFYDSLYPQEQGVSPELEAIADGNRKSVVGVNRI